MHRLTQDAIADGCPPKRCAVCDKPFRSLASVQWAEMATTGKWYQLGDLTDEAESQGCYPVGADCYRRILGRR